MFRCIPGMGLAVLVVLQASAAHAAITKTELAGNSLSEYPFFEYVKAINADSNTKVAVDPTRFPGIAGQTCDIYVVNAKNAGVWVSDPTLTDVTTGGFQTETFGGATIQANTFQVAAPSELSADAGLGLGVAYDVVLDCDRNGVLSDGDFIDGMSDEAGFYVVHDTTAPGPLAVTEEQYDLDPLVAEGFDIPGSMLAQDLYYPTDIASMGLLPLVVVGHGNGHQYEWYDHIGNHLASYGYIVISHDNNTGPGPNSAATTTLGHTDAFIDQAEAGAIAGGALTGHIDTSRIIWIGHSRGGEGVVIAYDRLFDGTHTPSHFSKSDIRLISSMLPTDFEGTDVANPHDANFHLWTASGDSDVYGGADTDCCQTFRIHDRAAGFRQSTIVQGTGHGWFHNEAIEDDPFHPVKFEGPCPIGEDLTHKVQLGYFLPLIKHYVDGNIPALDFLMRQYERFRPVGVPAGNPCIVVSHEYRNGSSAGNFVIDDYQTHTGTGTSSAGGPVTFDVENLTEGRLDDNNLDFTWSASDPFNGATQGHYPADTTRGVVFDWTDEDRFYEWEIIPTERDFSRFLYLSFRGAQGTRHPNTLDELADLTFSVTLRDVTGTTSTINIGAYGGGLEQPYQRSARIHDEMAPIKGWHNEMETIRIRLTDFLNNGSGLNLGQIAAVRLNVGPSWGSDRGRIVIDDLMLTSDISPVALQILEPTTENPAYAGTSEAGSRVLVRVVAAGGLDASPANLTVSVEGTNLTPAQIPTAAVVGRETWLVIAPGAKADGCYHLAVSLNDPSGIGATEPQSLCYADDETREFDRVIAVDQTNSMLRDGSTGVASTEKMDAARAAAKIFVDLSNANDQIGVVSFQRRDQDGDGNIVDPDELAEVEFPLVLAGEGATDQRDDARDAIDLIEPDTDPGFFGAETSPGAALVESRTMLDADGAPGHERVIVLLTDGLENYPPYWSSAGAGSPLKPGFEGGDIRLDTVSIGGDAADGILWDMSESTDGTFANLHEGSGSFFLLSRLASWYKAIDEDVRGEQRFYYAEGFPDETLYTLGDVALRAGYFIVEPNLDWMTVTFHTNVDNAASVSLIAPGGGGTVTASPPDITHRTDPKHSIYRIRHPEPGIWTYVVRPHDPAAEFFAVASGPTLLAARVGPHQLERRSGTSYAIPIRVWVADEDAVRSATVEGFIRRPGGTKVPVTLLDDGLSRDGAANDGIYGLEYVTAEPGAYYVELKASGASHSDEPFERYLSTAFVLPGQKKKPVQFGEGLPPFVPEGGEGGCGYCEANREFPWTVSLFSGITLPSGSFDTFADPSFSLGVKPEFHFSSMLSAGVYAGHDRFRNETGGDDFSLTHISPELQLSLPVDWCPRPAIHAGLGSYWDEDGDAALGFNAGASLRICLTERLTLLSRFDYRTVDALSRDYWTVQAGIRVRLP